MLFPQWLSATGIGPGRSRGVINSPRFFSALEELEVCISPHHAVTGTRDVRRYLRQIPKTDSMEYSSRVPIQRMLRDNRLLQPVQIESINNAQRRRSEISCFIVGGLSNFKEMSL